MQKLEVHVTKWVRMYNGGDRVMETLIYTKPDGSDIHANGHFLIDAPAAGFFEVPAEFAEGPATINPRFAHDLLARHGDRGVILVDRNLAGQELSPSDPRAASDEEAREKGRVLWLEHCGRVVQAYQEEIALVRAAGGAPRRPTGFTKRALDLLGIKDPTDQLLLEARMSKDEVAQLREQLAKQQQLLDRLLAQAQPAAPAGEEAPLLAGGGRRK